MSPMSASQLFAKTNDSLLPKDSRIINTLIAILQKNVTELKAILNTNQLNREDLFFITLFAKGASLDPHVYATLKTHMDKKQKKTIMLEKFTTSQRNIFSEPLLKSLLHKPQFFALMLENNIEVLKELSKNNIQFAPNILRQLLSEANEMMRTPIVNSYQLYNHLQATAHPIQHEREHQAVASIS